MSFIKSWWKKKCIRNLLFFSMPGFLLLHKTEIDKNVRDHYEYKFNFMRRWHCSACTVPLSSSFKLLKFSFAAHVDLAPVWMWTPFFSLQSVKWMYTSDVRQTWPPTVGWTQWSLPRLWLGWASNPEIFLQPRWDFAFFTRCNLEVVQMW